MLYYNISICCSFLAFVIEESFVLTKQGRINSKDLIMFKSLYEYVCLILCIEIREGGGKGRGCVGGGEPIALLTAANFQAALAWHSSVLIMFIMWVQVWVWGLILEVREREIKAKSD